MQQKKAVNDLYEKMIGNVRNVDVQMQAMLQRVFVEFQRIIKKEKPQTTSNEKTKDISKADEIEKFKKLLDAGAITEEEYDKEKRRILN